MKIRNMVWYAMWFPGVDRPGLIEAGRHSTLIMDMERFPGVDRPGLIEACTLDVDPENAYWVSGG